MSLNRINILNKEEIIQFFPIYKTLEKYRFPPNRILNMIKRALQWLAKKCLKIYGAKGTERIGTATLGERRPLQQCFA